MNDVDFTMQIIKQNHNKIIMLLHDMKRMIKILFSNYILFKWVVYLILLGGMNDINFTMQIIKQNDNKIIMLLHCMKIAIKTLFSNYILFKWVVYNNIDYLWALATAC